ncbi:MAG TPA: hypothetical protein VHS59_08605 [Bacillota bacterium]|nr:hypothetical protein [Bacillota bacterium]
MKITLHFVLHWIWSAVFGLLIISGFALTGAKFGWLMNYNLPQADFIHRTFAVVFTFLTIVAVGMEIFRIATGGKAMVWLIVGKSGFQLFTLLISLVFIITGVFIWTCNEYSKAAMVFGYETHELAAFVIAGALIWHLYKKAHALILD